MPSRKIKRLRQKEILAVLVAHPRGLSQSDVGAEAERLFKTPLKSSGTAFKSSIRGGLVEEVWINPHGRVFRITLNGKRKLSPYL